MDKILVREVLGGPMAAQAEDDTEGQSGGETWAFSYFSKALRTWSMALAPRGERGLEYFIHFSGAAEKTPPFFSA